MTVHESTNLNQAAELSPWVIVTQTALAGSLSQLAVWRMANGPAQVGQMGDEGSAKRDALALFSDEPAAERYAQQYCTDAATEYRVAQFSSIELVAVLAECYRMGMRWAALNPEGAAAQQLFVLRDVLAAARQRLRHTGSL